MQSGATATPWPLAWVAATPYDLREGLCGAEARVSWFDPRYLDERNAMFARNWWAVALRGLLAVVFGVIALAVPGAAMLSLALVFGAYLLIDGAFALLAAARAAERHERWGLLLAGGVLNLLMGVVALAFPGAAIIAFVFVTAAWAIINGALMVAAGFGLHPSHGRVWLVLGGLLSLAWGVVLVIAPLAGAVVLTWWLGLFAVLMGVLFVVLGFQLRRHRDSGPRMAG